MTGPSALRPALWLLVLITFSGTLAMHMFVPALPNAARDLGASVTATQMTISLYIVGLAVGQLVYGPLSDCFGRRPILLGGLVLYTAGGLAALVAPEVHILIGARLIQALGGCSGLVLGRAMVRDTAGSEDAARRLAFMNLMVTVGPGLAPLVGGALAATLGWRSIFIVLSALGVANLILTWRLLPETGRPSRTISVLSLGSDYKHLLCSPAFLGFSIGGGCATTSMYAFIAAAPFIFVDQLHQPPQEVGLYLGVLVVGVSAGSALAGRLIGRIAIERLMIGANMVSVAGAVIFLITVLTGRMTVPTTIGLMILFTLGAGMASPAALTKAISVNPKVIGSAAGLYGFTQMVVGAVCTSLSGLGGNPAMAAGGVLAAAGLVGQVAFWIALRNEARFRPLPEIEPPASCGKG
ncbi:multidrug effflux MFS transporter [Microvirga rosea]|uniref:multidrug effflux MFS transporter n=1 Tax=Microvirga rosea TaxID=2715425 RepID=UPI001D0AEC9E|nr:multidrug effflux MFS transporter [Microvirga rosea]MCB8821051.1 multidrug effflux MFS transporter [Microvirga rosea]